MGAWEDGFAAGYRYGLNQGGRTDTSPPLDVAKQRVIRSPTRKRVGKKDPKMARALKKANAMGRKKSGGFKKGWSQGKIMKKAHQLRRKM